MGGTVFEVKKTLKKTNALDKKHEEFSPLDFCLATGATIDLTVLSSCDGEIDDKNQYLSSTHFEPFSHEIFHFINFQHHWLVQI